MANLSYPSILTWQKAGLKYLLLSPEKIAEIKANAKVKASTTSVNPLNKTLVPSTKPAQPSTKTYTSQANSSATSQNPASSRTYVSKNEAGNPTKPVSKAQESPKIIEPTFNPKTLALADWYPKWQELYAKTPQNPMVVWTYKDFGEDLFGQPNPARKKMLAYFLTNLNHPKGTHAFWPTRIPNEENLENSLFWSGIEVLKPRFILAFGEETAEELALSLQLSLYERSNHQGKFIILLPSMNKLLEQASLVNSVLAFLQRNLAIFS